MKTQILAIVILAGFSSRGLQAETQIGDRAFTGRIGLFKEAIVLGLDYFQAIGPLEKPHKDLMRKTGVRFDLDLWHHPDLIVDAPQYQKSDKTSLRLAAYFLAYLQTSNSPVIGYAGLGPEVVYSDRLWESGNSVGGAIIYGLEVDTWGTPETENQQALLRIFFEGVGHFGHKRADNVEGKPHMVTGAGVNFGIRATY